MYYCVLVLLQVLNIRHFLDNILKWGRDIYLNIQYLVLTTWFNGTLTVFVVTLQWRRNRSGRSGFGHYTFWAVN